MQLTADRLAARRGEDLLFSEISFKLHSGEALVLTGSNGSGKSTLLRVSAGLLQPEHGRMSWAAPEQEAPVRVSEVCHYLGHRNAMKAELSVKENLAFWKSFFGDCGFGNGLSIFDAVERVGLETIMHLPFGYLSAGQQRRMAFAKLLVAYRPVWILDEPTASLDVHAESTFTMLIREHLEQDGIALIATHQPLELGHARELRMTGFSGVPDRCDI